MPPVTSVSLSIKFKTISASRTENSRRTFNENIRGQQIIQIIVFESYLCETQTKSLPSTFIEGSKTTNQSSY